MNVSAWSIRNPIPAVMLFVLLTLAGLMGFRAMKVQNFPDLDLPTVSVTASLPGTTARQPRVKQWQEMRSKHHTSFRHLHTHLA